MIVLVLRSAYDPYLTSPTKKEYVDKKTAKIEEKTN